MEYQISKKVTTWTLEDMYVEERFYIKQYYTASYKH